MKQRVYYTVTAKAHDGRTRQHNFMLSETAELNKLIRESRRTEIETVECSEHHFKLIFGIQ